MIEQSGISPQEVQDEIDPKLKNEIAEIVQKIKDIAYDSVGECIYRGEAELNPRVSSGLYRQYNNELKDKPELKDSQHRMVEKFKVYLSNFSNQTDFDILSQLQHYGGYTNLIDFTSDMHIALYFACYKKFNEYGRVIVLKTDNDRDYQVKKPSAGMERILPQKSVFVESDNGYINKKLYEVVTIPGYLKELILQELSSYNGISHESIYNDIHGFIEYPNIQPYYIEFEKVNEQIAARKKEQEDKQKNNDNLVKDEQVIKAEIIEDIKSYEIVKKLNPKFPTVYQKIIYLYWELGKYETCIEVCKEALQQKEKPELFYHTKGVVYFGMDEYQKSIECISKAIEINPNRPVFYYDRCLSYIQNLVSLQINNDEIQDDNAEIINEVKDKIKRDITELDRKFSYKSRSYIMQIDSYINNEKLNLPDDIVNYIDHLKGK